MGERPPGKRRSFFSAKSPSFSSGGTDNQTPPKLLSPTKLSLFSQRMKIKREDDETVVVAVASEEEASPLAASDPPPPPPTISVNGNNKLTPNQALECKYPPGCHVHFSITTNVVVLSRPHLSTTYYEARVGIVISIYFDFKSRDVVYEVLIEKTTNNNKQEERLFLLEEQLTFATNCQVMVKGIDATELGVEGLVGIITCHRLLTPDSSNKSYTIQFALDGGGRVIGMNNVDPKDVVYVPPSKSCNDDDDDDDDDGKGGIVETSNGKSLATAEGRKMDETNNNVHNNLDDQSSNEQQPLLTPLVSCDSASSSLTSVQLQQEEVELLNIRSGTSTTTRVDESLAVGTCSFEDTQNGTFQVQTKKQLSWEPPPNRIPASEDKQDCMLHVVENERTKEEFDVPYNIVRYIVGRGGEIIDDIQQCTGCTISIDREEIPAVGGMRTVTLAAHNLAAIIECIVIIERIVSEQMKRLGNFEEVESNCELTVPMWAIKKCTKDDELFSE